MRWLAVLVVFAACGLYAEANCPCGRCNDITCVNARLKGQVLDFTANHGCDKRIWSPALCQKRDLYVYVPPGFDAKKAYPLVTILHGATQDEQFFLQNLAERFDQAIVAGKLPPVIIAAPDGSLQGRPSLLRSASFFVNGVSGNFEDYLQQDVWKFVTETFPIRPERDAHALMGISAGGTGAFGQAIKYKDRYKVVIGIMPAVNLRWVDCRGHYRSKFDPNNWGWRNQLKPLEVVANFGVLQKVHAGQMYRPVVGNGADAIAMMSCINPIEILDRSDLKDGELSMYIAYAACDEFNIDTQVESFLFRARQRGLKVTTDLDPFGRHNEETGIRMMPKILDWVAPQVPPAIPLLPAPQVGKAS